MRDFAIFPIIAILLVLIAGCVGSSSQQMDRAFHEKAGSGSNELRIAVMNWSAAIEADDIDQSLAWGQIAIKEMNNQISIMEAMPVSEKMEPVKERYLDHWRYMLSLITYGSEGYVHLQNDEFDAANESFYYAEKLMNNDPGYLKEADQMYEDLYPSETTAQTGSSKKIKGYQIHIEYPYSWQGNYGDVDGQRSINGYGNDEIQVDSISGPLVVVIQKKGGDSKLLKIEILKNGEVVKSDSTSSPYGVISMTYRPGLFG